MWRVVHIAKKIEQAESIKYFLQTEGFLVEVGEADAAGFEIRVPSSEAEEAAAVLQGYRCSSRK